MQTPAADKVRRSGGAEGAAADGRRGCKNERERLRKDVRVRNKRGRIFQKNFRTAENDSRPERNQARRDLRARFFRRRRFSFYSAEIKNTP